MNWGKMRTNRPCVILIIAEKEVIYHFNTCNNLWKRPYMWQKSKRLKNMMCQNLRTSWPYKQKKKKSESKFPILVKKSMSRVLQEPMQLQRKNGQSKIFRSTGVVNEEVCIVVIERGKLWQHRITSSCGLSKAKVTQQPSPLFWQPRGGRTTDMSIYFCCWWRLYEHDVVWCSANG